MAGEKQRNPLEKPQADDPEEELVHNEAVDDFFTRMKYDLRRPRPGQNDVAIARQAIERMTVEGDANIPPQDSESRNIGLCSACGNENPDSHRFCGACGVPLHEADLQQPGERPGPGANVGSEKAAVFAGQHHYHHHYHHYLSPEGAQQSLVSRLGSAKDAQRPQAVLGGPSSDRAQKAVRKLTQDWSVACNIKHLDDLVELYATDALILRPNVPPIRGTAAIREFLFTVLDAGLGDVELESLRVEVFGDVAYEAGRSKMVVPVAMSKRREERGKYVVLSVRRAGEWRIICDSWSSDLSLDQESPSFLTPAPLPPRKPL